MAESILFIHGMFQNAKSWDRWVSFFSQRGYDCIVESWPLHEGDPAQLRLSPPSGLGELHLNVVIDHFRNLIRSRVSRPIVIGHSVGGLVVQKLAADDLISAGVAIASVAPNRMLAFDWGFFKNSVAISNPLAGNEIFEMSPEGFHQSFANILGEEDSNRAYEATATHDSRNILRDCMLKPGHIDLSKPHVPLLFIAAEEDQIIPPELCQKNAKAYEDKGSISDYQDFPNRGHFICGEPGWEEVATSVANWLSTGETSHKST
jgi:pimeloyl-ACP methyl ester carboxylesterase